MGMKSSGAGVMSGPEWWYKPGSLYEYSRQLSYPLTFRRVAPVEWEDHSERYRRMVEFIPRIWERWPGFCGSLREIVKYWHSHGPSRLSLGSLRYFLLFHGHWRNDSGVGILDRTREVLRRLSGGCSMSEAGRGLGFTSLTVSSWLYLLGFRRREKRDVYRGVLSDGGILTFRELLKKLRVGWRLASELNRECGLKVLFRERRRELLDRLDGENEVDGLPCWLLRHPRAAMLMLSLADGPKRADEIESFDGSSTYLSSKGSFLLQRMLSYGWLSRYRGDDGRYCYMLTSLGHGLLSRVMELMRGVG